MTRYEQGTSLEYDIMFMLKRDDYYVMRSSGSHGVVDLIAWWENQCLFIQCKKKSGGYEKRKREELIVLCQKLLPNPIPCFGFRQKIVKLTSGENIGSCIRIDRLDQNKETIFFWPSKAVRGLKQIAREEKRIKK